MARFDWAESSGTQLSQEPKVTRVQFGDGYSQRSPAGINHNPQRWSITIAGAGEVRRDHCLLLHALWLAGIRLDAAARDIPRALPLPALDAVAAGHAGVDGHHC
jgi:hypothetical protein